MKEVSLVPWGTTAFWWLSQFLPLLLVCQVLSSGVNFGKWISWSRSSGELQFEASPGKKFTKL
jgi:hypothetical protein